MRLVLPTLLCALALAAASCGDEDGEGGDGRGGGRPAAAGADLRVTVRPRGPGTSGRTVEIHCERLGRGAEGERCRRLGGLRAEQLAPVPVGRACAQIYGGPAVARVRGTLRGERVSARFDLSDGCEIARWRENARLLGPPPTGPGGPAG